MFQKLINFFPTEYAPSGTQVDLLKQITEKLHKNEKFIIVSAPTGIGKSFIPVTVGNSSNKPSELFAKKVDSYDVYRQDHHGNYLHSVECESEPPFGTFILTITKNLQDQYSQLFSYLPILKGKTNYCCNIDTNYDVETAPCLFVSRLKEECWEKNKCSYYNSRNAALKSTVSVLNYKMFFSLPSHVKRKNYIVCDEANELEHEIIKQYSVVIDYQKLEDYKINVNKIYNENSNQVRHWIMDLAFKLTEQINRSTGKKDSNLVIGERKKIISLKNLFNSIMTVDRFWDQIEWVVERNARFVKLTPLSTDVLAQNIFNYADQVILMSATIIDHKAFAKTLGIKKYAYIEAASTFDASKSPIYVTTSNKLNHSNIDRCIGNLAKSIKSICDMHKGQKGIIHTHSLDITEKLQIHLKDDVRFLFRDRITPNEEILKQHLNSPDPTVLVSPSLTHGVDLKDELARFCIIVKLPYLPLGDKRIKRKFTVDKEWYENTMLNNLVQMCGRTTRSKNDFSSTYLLDGHAPRIITNCKNKLPKYFLDRIY